MTSEANIAAAHRRLFSAAETGGDVSAPWADFVTAARSVLDDPPLHLAQIVGIAKRLRIEHPGREIKILDHGCGGAMTLLLLLADGFEGVYGIDMPQARCEALNRVTREVFSIPGQRFFRYTGQLLPFEDSTFDLVFSQQVVEHVRDIDLVAYYSEEGRILRPGGYAYHQVPHRLVPYDTHSKTWFLHWLPRRAQMAGYRALKRDANYLDSMLFLRSPHTHVALARTHIGPVEDLTAQRLTQIPDATRYDGPMYARRMIHRAANLPVVGPGIAVVLNKLVMLETIARKPGLGDIP